MYTSPIQYYTVFEIFQDWVVFEWFDCGGYFEVARFKYGRLI